MRYRKKLDQLAADLLGRRLAVTLDPLARARLKAAAGVRLDQWTDAELYALAEQLAPGAVERAQAAAAVEIERLDLATMSTEDLIKLAERLETPGDRARNPGAAEQRRILAQHIALAEGHK